MKSFTYGDHLPVGTPSNGKIEIATRGNYPLIGGSPFEVIVTETYTRGWLTGIPGYLSSITYHNNLQMNVLTHPNGVTVTYAKDPNQMARPASIATSAGWSTGTYAYDGSGNIVRIGPLLSGSWYLYDGVSRLVQSSTRTGIAGGGGTATQNLSFDPFGNIQSITNDGVVRSTPTSGATNRLTGAVVCDSAGNLTSWNGNTYEYGPFGEMSAYRSGTESWLYLYTVDEERVRAYDLARSIGYFAIRDLDGRLLRENRSNAWSTPKDYVYPSDGRLVSSIEGSTVRHLHVDHLGSVRQITNSSGGSVEYHVYYPFGEEATATGTEQMKFTGHERDLANPAGVADDLDYMHARFANPMLGRFLGPDRRGGKAPQPQSWNRYAYALGSPLKYIDPDGEESLAAIQFELDVQAFVAGDITRAEFLDRLQTRGSVGLFGVTLLTPSPLDDASMLAGAASSGSRLAGLGTRLGTFVNLVRSGASITEARVLSRAGTVTLQHSLSKSLVQQGGNLEKVLGAIQGQFARANPSNAMQSLEAVGRATQAVGLETGVLSRGTGGIAFVLKNAGGVTTYIMESGQLLIKKGTQTVLRLLPR